VLGEGAIKTATNGTLRMLTPGLGALMISGVESLEDKSLDVDRATIP
jgi:hypothetical protein